MSEEKLTPALMEEEVELLWDNFLQLWEELNINTEYLPLVIKKMVNHAKVQVGAVLPILTDDLETKSPQTESEKKHEVISAYLWNLDHCREAPPNGLPKRIIRLLDAMLTTREKIRERIPTLLQKKKLPIPLPLRVRVRVRERKV